MPDQNRSTEIGNDLQHPSFEQQQRRRMLIALGVLLIALISVLIKDRQYWFPPTPGVESESPEQAAPQAATSKTIPRANSRKAAAPAVTHARSKAKPLAKTTRSAAPQSDESPVIIATNRAVLPPLEVEVVAGNQHRAVKPGDSSVKLDMQPSDPVADKRTSAPAQTQDNGPVENHAAAQVQMSSGNAQVVSRVSPTYPLLAKQMKVQGAVILEALISRTGSIQGIQVLSGPAILSEAAREAVKQWHFKPYYQGGQPVETEARITVNFTISTY
jgi:TonB family protein